MLVTVGVAVGLATVVDDNDGPLQAYVVTVPDGDDVKFTVPPTHIGLLFVGDAVGVGLIDTKVVPVTEHDDPEKVTTTE